MREEENKSVTKLKVKRLMRKKWLYPALYLSVAALVLAGVFWYQQAADNAKLAEEPNNQIQDEFVTHDSNQETVPVMEQQEILEMPVAEESAVTIVTNFYDYDATEAEQESALVQYHNKYYQSKGIDLTREDGEAFDVVASLSGQVTEVKEDPLYGNVVEITHDDGISTVYASLSDVQVKAGTNVTQGDTLGTAGTNSFGQASGVHVHFEVRKDGEPMNPESFLGKPLSAISEATKAEETSTETETPAAEENLPTHDELEGTTDPEQTPAEDEAPAEDPTEGEAPEEDPTDSEQAPSDEEGETPSEDSASSITTMHS